ncbi:C-type lectin domain family 4 member F-like [Elgaria multicarinata webbii]|uniref:C-type lectin domain family 4 member F-like n=1 Tax=Elgaria multicarinata webbii TaxID=159646 RepID=UPI002FCD51BE
MVREINYENAVGFKADDTAPAPSHKRTISVMAFLLLLILLLAILLTAVAILYFQRQRTVLELEGVVKKIRKTLQLSNISYASEKASENVQFLENIHGSFSKIQTRLENISVSRTAFEKRYRNVLGLLSTGWTFYDGSFYFLFQEAKSWHEAEQACESHGAHLTSVTSRKEMDYLFREARGQFFWIGLTDQREEGTWSWVDGEKYKDLGFWGRGQPDNWHGAPGHHEDCVHVSDHWNDVSCTYHYKGFCKKVFP